MRKLFENPWTVLIIAVAIVAISVWQEWAGASFKPDILTDAVPALVAGLLAISVFVERSVSVLNDVWFGEEREKVERSIRLVGEQMAVEQATRATVLEAQRTVLQEAARAGNDALVQRNAGLTPFAATVTQLNTKTAALTSTLQDETRKLTEIEAKQDRARLSFALVVGLLVGAVGVRVLGSLLDEPSTPATQATAFRIMDILVSGGVIAGGTTGINAISDLLGTYVDRTRQRAQR